MLKQCWLILNVVLVVRGALEPLSPRNLRAFSQNTPNYETETVRFHLYTKKTAINGEQLRTFDVNALQRSAFNALHSTRILIHGWNGHLDSNINKRLRSAYNGHVNSFNVIVVDWSPTSQSINYPSVRGKLPAIGKLVGEFVEFLRVYGSLSYNRTQIIGHSLGAHVAGFAGKDLRARDGFGLAAIVGLDPARPLFDIDKPHERLTSSDAQYVQTIHTNRGLNGFSRPIGVAAFYPNWGEKQVGCGSDKLGKCAHKRAVLLFEESVTRPFRRFFQATRCANGYDDIKGRACRHSGLAEMGGEPLWALEAKRRTEGVFFVATFDQSPFGMAQSSDW